MNPKTERSGDGVEVLAQRVPIDAGSKLFNLFVSALPDKKSTGEQAAPFRSEDEDAAAAVRGVGPDSNQAAPHQRLKSRGQGCSIHRQERSDRAHGRRFRTIEGHQQGELPVGQVEGAQLFVETPGQSARRTLHMKTKTTVLDHQRCFEGQGVCA
jgi:hypothetical protein